MTPIAVLWNVLGIAWAMGEFVLARRGRGMDAPERDGSYDRGSFRLIWLTTLTAVLGALWVTELRWLPLGWEGASRQIVALVLFGGGITLRLWAIVSLGRFFDTRVTLHDQHRLIQSGPYRWLRHPSYSGLLLAFAAGGLAMGDGLALAAMTLPVTAAVLVRIRLEERALTLQFPREYEEYRSQSWMLIPWIC